VYADFSEARIFNGIKPFTLGEAYDVIAPRLGFAA
jgi:hypothetical protein